VVNFEISLLIKTSYDMKSQAVLYLHHCDNLHPEGIQSTTN